MKKLLLTLLSFASLTQFNPLAYAQAPSIEEVFAEVIQREKSEKEWISSESWGKLQSLVSNANLNNTEIQVYDLAKILLRAQDRQFHSGLSSDDPLAVKVSNFIAEANRYMESRGYEYYSKTLRLLIAMADTSSTNPDWWMSKSRMWKEASLRIGVTSSEIGLEYSDFSPEEITKLIVDVDVATPFYNSPEVYVKYMESKSAEFQTKTVNQIFAEILKTAETAVNKFTGTSPMITTPREVAPFFDREMIDKGFYTPEHVVKFTQWFQYAKRNKLKIEVPILKALISLTANNLYYDWVVLELENENSRAYFQVNNKGLELANELIVYAEQTHPEENWSVLANKVKRPPFFGARARYTIAGALRQLRTYFQDSPETIRARFLDAVTEAVLSLNDEHYMSGEFIDDIDTIEELKNDPRVDAETFNNALRIVVDESNNYKLNDYRMVLEILLNNPKTDPTIITQLLEDAVQARDESKVRVISEILKIEPISFPTTTATTERAESTARDAVATTAPSDGTAGDGPRSEVTSRPEAPRAEHPTSAAARIEPTVRSQIEIVLVSEAIIEKLRESVIGSVMSQDLPSDPRRYTSFEPMIRREIVKILFEIAQDFNDLSDQEVIQLIKELGEGEGQFKRYFNEVNVKLNIEHRLSNGSTVNPYHLITSTVKTTLNNIITNAHLPIEQFKIKDDRTISDPARRAAEEAFRKANEADSASRFFQEIAKMARF